MALARSGDLVVVGVVARVYVRDGPQPGRLVERARRDRDRGAALRAPEQARAAARAEPARASVRLVPAQAGLAHEREIGARAGGVGGGVAVRAQAAAAVAPDDV